MSVIKEFYHEHKDIKLRKSLYMLKYHNKNNDMLDSELIYSKSGSICKFLQL